MYRDRIFIIVSSSFKQKYLVYLLQRSDNILEILQRYNELQDCTCRKNLTSLLRKWNFQRCLYIKFTLFVQHNILMYEYCLYKFICIFLL